MAAGRTEVEGGFRDPERRHQSEDTDGGSRGVYESAPGRSEKPAPPRCRRDAPVAAGARSGSGDGVPRVAAPKSGISADALQPRSGVFDAAQISGGRSGISERDAP